MMLERERQRALLRLRLRDIAARDDAEFFCCFCLFFSRNWRRRLIRFFFNKRVESSLSVDSKRHDERRRVMCYDVRFINVLLLCKKVFLSLSLSLSFVCFAFLAKVVCILYSGVNNSALLLLALSFFSLFLQFFFEKSNMRRYYYLLLNLTLVRVFLLNLWR